MNRFALALAGLALVVPVAGTAMTAGPVIKQKDKTFGNILATCGHKALYYWNVEKRAGGKVRCPDHAPQLGRP
jgi:hypothetical protein